jgi:ActD protein
MAKSLQLYGLIAEFDDPTSLVAATERAHAEGYRCMDAYSPFPIEELHHALGAHMTRLPLIVLIGGLVGCVGGYALQYWASAIAYPLNVGGKPLHSWPAFIPVTFECTILVAALSAVLGMLALNGLPMPYHPVFNVDRFAFATKDRFFLIVFSSDKKYDSADTRHFLEGLKPRSIAEVPS